MKVEIKELEKIPPKIGDFVWVGLDPNSDGVCIIIEECDKRTEKVLYKLLDLKKGRCFSYEADTIDELLEYYKYCILKVIPNEKMLLKEID